jgi:hypothetical protein
MREPGLLGTTPSDERPADNETHCLLDDDTIFYPIQRVLLEILEETRKGQLHL